MRQTYLMSAKQWLLLTAVMIVNIIILGALIGAPEIGTPSTPTPTWTPYPTFTALPRATATAILMPTLAPQERVPGPVRTPVPSAERP
jgi:hypothetical protein